MAFVFKCFSFAMVLSLLLGCSGVQPAPTTSEEFISTYRTAYDSGDKAGVVALVKWDGVPNDLREFQEGLLTWFIGKHQVSSVELIPYVPDPEIPVEFNGRVLTTNLEPKYWLVVENKGLEGFEGAESKGSLKHAVGDDDGVLRFCGVLYAEP